MGGGGTKHSTHKMYRWSIAEGEATTEASSVFRHKSMWQGNGPELNANPIENLLAGSSPPTRLKCESSVFGSLIHVPLRQRKKEFDSILWFLAPLCLGKDAQGPLAQDARVPFRHPITQGPGFQESCSVLKCPVLAKQ